MVSAPAHARPLSAAPMPGKVVSTPAHVHPLGTAPWPSKWYPHPLSTRHKYPLPLTQAQRCTPGWRMVRAPTQHCIPRTCARSALYPCLADRKRTCSHAPPMPGKWQAHPPTRGRSSTVSTPQMARTPAHRAPALCYTHCMVSIRLSAPMPANGKRTRPRALAQRCAMPHT